VCGFGHGLISRCAVAQNSLDNTAVQQYFLKISRIFTKKIWLFTIIQFKIGQKLKKEIFKLIKENLYILILGI